MAILTPAPSCIDFFDFSDYRIIRNHGMSVRMAYLEVSIALKHFNERRSAKLIKKYKSLKNKYQYILDKPLKIFM